MAEQLRLTPEEILANTMHQPDNEGYFRAVADAATAQAVRWCCTWLREHRGMCNTMSADQIAGRIEVVARAEGVEVKDE